MAVYSNCRFTVKFVLVDTQHFPPQVWSRQLIMSMVTFMKASASAGIVIDLSSYGGAPTCNLSFWRETMIRTYLSTGQMSDSEPISIHWSYQ